MEWIKVGKGKNVVRVVQVEAPEVDLPSSSTLPLCNTIHLEAEGTDCIEETGEIQDDSASKQAVPPNGEVQAEVNYDADTREPPRNAPSPLPLSPVAIMTDHMYTEPSKGANFLPRSPLTRSQSLNKMDPVVMEGQGTQEDPLTPVVTRASSTPSPPGRSNSMKKKNKRSK
ncbi:hypothetical protein U1Q18_010228 [Sarracenia purpurea var. burkii]